MLNGIVIVCVVVVGMAILSGIAIYNWRTKKKPANDFEPIEKANLSISEEHVLDKVKRVSEKAKIQSDYIETINEELLKHSEASKKKMAEIEKREKLMRMEREALNKERRALLKEIDEDEKNQPSIADLEKRARAKIESSKKSDNFLSNLVENYDITVSPKGPNV